LELIYFDVWGPVRSTVHGEKYYVSFVDAYSRFTWIYLLRQESDTLLFSIDSKPRLKDVLTTYIRFTWIYLLRQKSDVFAVFHRFQAKVERSLDRKIKIVQTDLGGGVLEAPFLL
jgi:hypothetical protein